MRDLTPNPDEPFNDVASKKEVAVLRSPDRRSTNSELALHNAILASYLSESRPVLAKRILACSNDGFYCRSMKLCAFCRVKRGQRLLWQRQEELARRSNWYHLTLTVPNTATLDRKTLDDIRKAFKVMRKTKMFSSSVSGGLVNLAADWTGDSWHPHLHALLDCQEPPDKRELCEAWRRQTGGQQVKLQRVFRGTAGEVFHYGTKLDSLPLNGELLAEYLKAVHGTRLVVGWGTLYRLPEPITELTISEVA